MNGAADNSNHGESVELLEVLHWVCGADLQPHFDRQIARRSLREATAAWPGDEEALWWKWIVEAGNSVAHRVRIVDGSIPQAIEFAREGARTVVRCPDDRIGYVMFTATRGRRFHVNSDRWRKSRLMTPRQLSRLLRANVDEPVRIAFCDPVELSVDSDHAGGHSTTPWERLRTILRPEWPDIRNVIVFALFVGLLTLATPIAVEALVNTVAFGQLLQPVIILALMLLSFLFFSGAMRALQSWSVEIIQQRLFARVAVDLAFRLPRVRSSAFDEEYGPELVNRFFDIVTIQKVSAQLLMDGITLLLGAIIGMTVLAFYHPWLLAFDLFLLVMILLIVFGLGRGAVATSIKESKCKYRLAAWLEELARCHMTFKHDGAPEFAAERTDRLTVEYLTSRKKHFRIVFRQILFSLGLQAVASTVLLGLGGWLVISGQLNLGQLVAAELIVTVIVGSFAKLGKHLESFYDLLTSVDKLGHLFDLPLERQHGALSVIRETPAALEFRNVTVDDLGGPWSFQVAPGDRVAVTGPAGSGKTAIANLGFGLRQPSSGHVLLDDFDVRDLRPDVLRHHVALVRKPEIFEGSVMENVALERPDVNLSEVQDALRDVGLLQVVLALPNGLETRLSTEGKPLSDTQTLRLMLARAIVGKPRLLIIDRLLDALSYDELAELLPTFIQTNDPRTLLVMTGRRLIVELCNRHIVMPSGTLAALKPNSETPN